jgi:hypothetical protein
MDAEYCCRGHPDIARRCASSRSVEGLADRETIRRALATDAASIDSLEQSLRIVPAESIRTADAVTAQYLERLRLGLGSPFRLIEQMQRDTWLPEERRRALGHAMLERTALRNGGAYQSDPDALSLLDPEGSAVAVSGSRHAALIGLCGAGWQVIRASAS